MEGILCVLLRAAFSLGGKIAIVALIHWQKGGLAGKDDLATTLLARMATKNRVSRIVCAVLIHCILAVLPMYPPGFLVGPSVMGAVYAASMADIFHRSRGAFKRVAGLGICGCAVLAIAMRNQGPGFWDPAFSWMVGVVQTACLAVVLLNME